MMINKYYYNQIINYILYLNLYDNKPIDDLPDPTLPITIVRVPFCSLKLISASVGLLRSPCFVDEADSDEYGDEEDDGEEDEEGDGEDSIIDYCLLYSSITYISYLIILLFYSLI
jgi:hypothetical protein